MSHGWSVSDKIAVKKLVQKARSAAETEAIRLHRDTRIERIEDLWALELAIREWRRERQHVVDISYASAEQRLADWIRRGWLSPSDVSLLSPERRDRVVSQHKP